MKKLVVFIDGENLFYSFKSLELDIHNFKLDEFFRYILTLSDLNKDDIELLRVYWYQIKGVSHHDIKYEILRNHIKKELQKDPARYPFNIDDLFRIGPDRKFIVDITPEMEKRIKWVNDQKQKISFQQEKFTKIALDYSRIEFVREGVLKVNPYAMEIKGEKGVDVSMAVDLIKKSDYFDIAFIISGDADLAPAIKYIKDKLKLVYVVRFFKGVPPKTRGSSSSIREIADDVIDVYSSELEKFKK